MKNITISASAFTPPVSCAQCKYVKRNRLEEFMEWKKFSDAVCTNPIVSKPEIDVVSGKPDVSYVDCSHARNVNEVCGPKGELWEPKNYFAQSLRHFLYFAPVYLLVLWLILR